MKEAAIYGITLLCGIVELPVVLRKSLNEILKIMTSLPEHQDLAPELPCCSQNLETRPRPAHQLTRSAMENRSRSPDLSAGCHLRG